MAKPDNAVEMNPPCDLTPYALKEAANIIGPAFVYTLKVNPDCFVETKEVVLSVLGIFKDNPFAPYVNIIVDETYDWCEWSMETSYSGITKYPNMIWSGGA